MPYVTDSQAHPTWSLTNNTKLAWIILQVDRDIG